MPVLDVQNINVNYGKKHVLQGASCCIQPGEIFGLVGVNGAGKTTLLKSILDFIPLTSGQITLFGTPHVLTLARQDLAFLPEQFTPPSFLTGTQFLQMMAQFYRAPPLTPTNRTTITQQLDFDEAVLDQPIRKYSKGMRQKLGLISLFTSKKPLLLLDEPLSGLDPKARILVSKYMQSLNMQGTTILMSTHLLNDVESLCHHMGILHAGQFEIIATPDECKQKYQANTLEQAYLTCIGATSTQHISPN